MQYSAKDAYKYRKARKREEVCGYKVAWKECAC
jgi:hypothetical protein